MRKLAILIAATALAVFGLAACGGGGSNQQAASSDDQGSAAAAAPAATETSAAVEATSAEVQNPASIESNTMGEAATYDYDGKGIIFFDYPTATFKEDPSAILGTIEALDGSVTIKFNADQTFETDGKQKRLDYLDGYADCEGYSADDLTIAGLPAHRIFYVDPDWGDAKMEIMIDLEGTAQDKYTDICAIVTGKDFDRIGADDVMAILNTIRIG